MPVSIYHFHCILFLQSRGVDPNESEMGSDVESENDDDDDDINNIDLEKLDTSHREMLEKLKRQQRKNETRSNES